jgi:hypothetical protein
MAASNIRAQARRFPLIPLIVLLLAAGVGDGWALHYANTKLVAGAGLPLFGSLFTAHILVAAVMITLVSMRCELFIPTAAELRFFALAGAVGTLLALAVEMSAGPDGTRIGWVLAGSLAPLGFGLSTALLAVRRPRRLNALQAATGIAVAVTAMLIPFAGFEGEVFVIDGHLGASDLAITAFALGIGAEYYLLTRLTR